MRTVPWGCLLAVLCACSVSCAPAASEKASTAAPPLVVCGTTLNDLPAGAVMEDATVPGGTVITAVTTAGLLFVRVAPGCAHGARVTWQPAAAATLVREATATDGQAVAVVLQPAAGDASFTLIATASGTRVAYASVRLSGNGKPTPASG